MVDGSWLMAFHCPLAAYCFLLAMTIAHANLSGVFGSIKSMAEKPLTLSLVIPAYNEERYIKHCLDAIASQTVTPMEVFVVDNNSTDSTAAIAKNYEFVQVLSEP